VSHETERFISLFDTFVDSLFTNPVDSSTAANIATSLGRKRKEVAQITTQSSEVLMNETM
jgi:hypothetical protein